MKKREVPLLWGFIYRRRTEKEANGGDVRVRGISSGSQESFSIWSSTVWGPTLKVSENNVTFILGSRKGPVCPRERIPGTKVE